MVYCPCRGAWMKPRGWLPVWAITAGWLPHTVIPCSIATRVTGVSSHLNCIHKWLTAFSHFNTIFWIQCENGHVTNTSICHQRKMVPDRTKLMTAWKTCMGWCLWLTYHYLHMVRTIIFSFYIQYHFRLVSTSLSIICQLVFSTSLHHACTVILARKATCF